MGWKDPDAPISALKPSTVETGSNLPFKADSSKVPNRLFAVVLKENITVSIMFGRVEEYDLGTFLKVRKKTAVNVIVRGITYP